MYSLIALTSCGLYRATGSLLELQTLALSVGSDSFRILFNGRLVYAQEVLK